MKFAFRNKTFRSWLWVVLCSIAIFLTVPVARTIQIYVSNKWSRALFGYFVLFVLAIAFIILFYFLIYKLQIRSPSNYIWLISIGGLYTYFTLKLWKAPEEAIHFLEYGLLGFFLFKALSHNVKDNSIYITATLFALLIGTFDELLQWITPERYWDFRDTGLNGLSGGLFQLTVWKVVRPKIISEKLSGGSLRIFSSVLAGCLILLGLCASNTPQRVSNYTERIPFLSFLKKEEPMSEFGYKYKDPEIGVFYSRLSPKKLQKIDKKKGKDYGQLLNKTVNMKYEQFLTKYNPSSSPFLHELRVHVFRRDKYFGKGNNTSDVDKKKEFYFIAYKENLILQKYYWQSIKSSVYCWNEDKIRKSEKLIANNKSYESPVSANLFTSFAEKSMWITIFALTAFLLVINLVLTFKKNKKINV